MVFQVNVGGLLTLDANADTTQLPYFKYISSSGWFDAPAVRTTAVNRPINDGDYRPGRSFRSGKVMSFTGLCEASSYAAAEQLFDELAAISPTGWDIPITVTTDNGVRTMNARVSGNLTVVPFTPRKANFMVPLYAWDPRKLGPVRTASMQYGGAAAGGLAFPLFDTSGLLAFRGMVNQQSLTVTNNGKAPTFPLFTIAGTVASGFMITDVSTGKRYVYGASISSSTVLQIDTSTERVTAGGVSDETGNLSEADDLTVYGGETHTYVFQPLGSVTGVPNISVAIQDAWW